MLRKLLNTFTLLARTIFDIIKMLCLTVFAAVECFIEYMRFLILESPNIISIISFPILLGIFLNIPGLQGAIIVIDTVFLCIYLLEKARKYNRKRSIPPAWLAFLFFTAIFLGYLVIAVVVGKMGEYKLTFETRPVPNTYATPVPTQK